MAEPTSPLAAPNPGQGSQTGGFRVPDKFQGKSAEEIVQAYLELEQLRNRDIETWRPVQARLQELEPYGGLEGLISAYGQIFNQLQQVMSQQRPQQPEPAQPSQNQQGAPDAGMWDQIDYMTPQQQAAYIEQQISNRMRQEMQQLYQQAVQQAGQTIQARLDQGLSGVQSQWDVYRQAMEVHRQHPNTDITQLLQEAVSLSQSKPENLLSLAAERLANKDGAVTKAQATEMFERMKADWLQQQQNERMAAAQTGSTVYQNRLFSPEENADTLQPNVHDMVMEKLLSDPESGFTPEHFTG